MANFAKLKIKTKVEKEKERQIELDKLERKRLVKERVSKATTIKDLREALLDILE